MSGVERNMRCLKMTKENGWWDLIITEDFELTDTDREHIAELIKKGFTSGELINEINR